MKFLTTIVFSMLLCCAPFTSSQQLNADNLAQGRDLLAHLSSPVSSDADVDKAAFEKVGFDQAEQDLTAITTEDQRASAKRQDWPELHRAFDALIELNILQDHLYQASIYANLQDVSYRRNEGDYTRAMVAASEALGLQQRSGETTTLFLPWKALGEDLVQVGRIDEGVADLYKARSLVVNPKLSSVAELRYEIVSLESSRANSAVAQKESAAFLASVDDAAPPINHAYALLAAANVAIDDHRFDDAIIQLHASLNTILHSPERPRVTDQIIASLMALAMEAVHSLPYEQALALCARLDSEFPHLPIKVSTFAHQVDGKLPAAAASRPAKRPCGVALMEEQIVATLFDLSPGNSTLLPATGRTAAVLKQRMVRLEATLAAANKAKSDAEPCKLP